MSESAKRRLKRISPWLVVILLVVIAWLFRMADKQSQPKMPLLSYLRSFIYIGLFSCWGVYSRRRIIQVQVRRYMSAVVLLILLWMVERTVKYMLITNADISRYLWYGYYLPILFLPVFCLFIALYSGKSEAYRLPAKAGFFLLVSALLFALVITNDFHRIVFSFPADAAVLSDGDYGHEVGYAGVCIWAVICCLAWIVLIGKNSRIPGSKKRIIAPLVPLALMIAYGSSMLMKLPFQQKYFNDLPLTACLLTAATLESLMRVGLIQTNTRYRSLMRASAVPVSITDVKGDVYIASESAQPLNREIIKKTEAAPVLTPDNVRISSAPITGGRVVWQEDISLIISVTEQLNENNEELKSFHDILQEELKQKEKILRLEEKNNLYDELRLQSARQTEVLSDLLSELRNTQDDAAARRLLFKVTILGAYLKRRNNMIFLSRAAGRLTSTELERSLEELAGALKAGGVACAVRVCTVDYLPVHAAELFDFCEAVMEKVWDDVSAVLISAEQENGRLEMRICVSSDADVSVLEGEYTDVNITRDDDGIICLSKGIALGQTEAETKEGERR